jgi:hypothetical protein
MSNYLLGWSVVNVCSRSCSECSYLAWDFPRISSLLSSDVIIMQKSLDKSGGYISAVLRGWQDHVTGNWELRSSSTPRLARWSYGKLRVTIQQYSVVVKMILREIESYDPTVLRSCQDDLTGNWELRSNSTPRLTRWSYRKLRVTIQQYSAVGKMILGETVGYSSGLHRWLRYSSKIRWGVFRIWGFHSSG